MPKNIHGLTILSNENEPNNQSSEQAARTNESSASSITVEKTVLSLTAVKSDIPAATSVTNGTSVKTNLTEIKQNLELKKTTDGVKAKPRPPPLNSLNQQNPQQLQQQPPNDIKFANEHSPNHSSKHSAKTVQQLTNMVQKLDITDSQKDKLEEFLKCREKIGDLQNEDLSVEGELGSGNGGVVLKVRHRKTGTVMAKKVILNLRLYLSSSCFKTIGHLFLLS